MHVAGRVAILVLSAVGATTTAHAEDGEVRSVQPAVSSFTGYGEGSLVSLLRASITRYPEASGAMLALRGEGAWLGDMAGTWFIDGELAGVAKLGDGNLVGMGLSVRHARNLSETAFSYADEFAPSRTGVGFVFDMLPRGAADSDFAPHLRFTTHLYGLSGAGFDLEIGPSFGPFDLALLMRLDTVIGSGLLLGGTYRL